MRRLLRPFIDAAAFVGFDVHRATTLRQLPRFTRDALAYRRRARGPFELSPGDLAPILTDFHAPAGIARGQYFHQDLWAARLIYARRPAAHVDIGSRIDGFIAHLLTFMPVTVVDIRPLETDVAGLHFVQGDMCRLDGVESGSIDSLSCLHTIEHVGLGRYGDSIDPDGWRVALRELARVLAPGGRLYLGTPIGRERVCFNSERVFSPRTILDAVPALRPVSLAAIDERECFVPDADLERMLTIPAGCGLFELTRP
jgi:SAM-dependent methyltransferase